jgi:hypothetical protein
MQPKGPPPFQPPGTPQFPPPRQSPLSPQSPPSPSWFPWGLSCGNGIPATPGDDGLAFATPVPSPNAVRPSAQTMAASAKILISFIVQTPLYDASRWNATQPRSCHSLGNLVRRIQLGSLYSRPLRLPPQDAARVLALGSKGVACPAAPRPVIPFRRVAGGPSPEHHEAAEPVQQRLNLPTFQ